MNMNMNIISKIIKIQKWVRHFLKGKKIRNNMKYQYKGLFKLKSFVIRCALDDFTFTYCKSYKKYIENVYNSIEVLINQDSDDEENYSLSFDQITIIKNILKKSRITFLDVKTVLKQLSIDQIQFIQ